MTILEVSGDLCGQFLGVTSKLDYFWGHFKINYIFWCSEILNKTITVHKRNIFGGMLKFQVFFRVFLMYLVPVRLIIFEG